MTGWGLDTLFNPSKRHMDEEKQRKIASEGGKAAHEKGTAHEFTSEEARVAGQKGGRATHAKRRTSTRPEAEPTTEEKGS